MKNITTLMLVFTLSTSAFLAQGAKYKDNIRINGFSNIIVGKTNNSNELLNYSDEADFSNESLFALQVSSDIGDKFTATGQIIARGRNDYSADVEWAYLTYKATKRVSLTAGRFRLPLFRYSDSLDIGHSYHWLMPPSVVYNVPYNNIDGIRVDFKNNIGYFEYSSQFAFGNIKNESELLGQVAKLKATNSALLNLNMEYYNWKVRLVTARTDFTMSLDVIDNALIPLETISPSLFNTVSINDDTGVFLGFGIEYDAFDWFVGGEYTKVSVDESYYPDEISYYATAGLRIDKWMPSITLQFKDSTKHIKFIDQAEALPEDIADGIAELLTSIQSPIAQKYVAINITVRYDVTPRVSIKADIVKMDDRTVNDLDTTLFRTSVNYVF